MARRQRCDDRSRHDAAQVATRVQDGRPRHRVPWRQVHRRRLLRGRRVT